jgi:hypothetical protein
MTKVPAIPDVSRGDGFQGTLACLAASRNGGLGSVIPKSMPSGLTRGWKPVSEKIVLEQDDKSGRGGRPNDHMTTTGFFFETRL